jgi:hypothetical protein
MWYVLWYALAGVPAKQSQIYAILAALAVGAVHREPFSTANSLLTGKITGNLAESGLIILLHLGGKPHFVCYFKGK